MNCLLNITAVIIIIIIMYNNDVFGIFTTVAVAVSLLFFVRFYFGSCVVA